MDKIMNADEWLKETRGGHMNSPFEAMSSYAEYYHNAMMDKEWIDVNDEDPQDGQEVYITHESDKWVSIGYKSKSTFDWYANYDPYCPCYPSHWQPLPTPPKQ